MCVCAVMLTPSIKKSPEIQIPTVLNHLWMNLNPIMDLLSCSADLRQITKYQVSYVLRSPSGRVTHLDDSPLFQFALF